MAGETDLAKLLATMAPVLFPQTYVYCTVPHDEAQRYMTSSRLRPIARTRALR